jgi:hypothetical protein
MHRSPAAHIIAISPHEQQPSRIMHQKHYTCALMPHTFSVGLLLMLLLVACIQQVCVAHHPADVLRQLHLARPSASAPTPTLPAVMHERVVLTHVYGCWWTEQRQRPPESENAENTCCHKRPHGNHVHGLLNRASQRHAAAVQAQASCFCALLQLYSRNIGNMQPTAEGV